MTTAASSSAAAVISTVSKRFLRFSISAASFFSEDAAGMVFVPRRYRIISSFGALVMSTFPSPVR